MALPRPPAHRPLVSGAALGPLLAGLLSPSGWTNVFYMLMFADACALLVSRPALIQAALRERLCGVGQRRATPLPVVSAALREVGPVTYPSVPVQGLAGSGLSECQKPEWDSLPCAAAGRMGERPRAGAPGLGPGPVSWGPAHGVCHMHGLASPIHVTPGPRRLGQRPEPAGDVPVGSRVHSPDSCRG